MIDRLEKEVDILYRHISVLEWVLKKEPIGILKMSKKTGYRQHKVRYSFRKLEEQNLIVPTRQGAVTTEKAKTFVEEFDERNRTVREKLTRLNSGTKSELDSLGLKHEK
ncbi:hypothetical protein DMJ13_22785 [halophilic archaeon]|nr:hypothetical protein DMJ13_22785 [halophilic archaeon]